MDAKKAAATKLRNRPVLVRTNIVLDRALVEEVKRRTGAKSAREAVQIALERVGGKPDYSGLLELWKLDPIRPFYDPEDPMAEERAEVAGRAKASMVRETRAHYAVSGAKPKREPKRR